MYKGTFFEIFGQIGDPRQEGKVMYGLCEVLFIVLSAVICGCNNWKEVYSWVTLTMNIEWLETHIFLLYGIPSETTIRDVFKLIDPEEFEELFITWIKTIIDLPTGDIVSIDGKTMRGSKDKKNGKKGLHIVSALCNSYGLVIGQVKTEEKSNEITAIPELLDKLFIEGCIITIDAIGTQKNIVEKIVDNKADYVLNLKGNQENLFNDVKNYYSDLEEAGVLEELSKNHGQTNNNENHILVINNDEKYNGLEFYTTTDKGHGRIEKRDYYFSVDIEWLNAKEDWKKLTGIGMVDREVIINDKITKERCYYIASVDNVRDFARSVRGHWGVESMHWSLDVTFRDDDNRTRNNKGAQNMALIKRIAFNLLHKGKEMYTDLSKACKRIKAFGDLNYRDYLLKSQ